MIIGIGVDIIEIDRIKRACKNENFLKKVFTENEINDYKNIKFNSLAGNFAVKEAVSKAFGTGIRSFNMTDIEVLRNNLGMPYVILHNGAKEISEKKGIVKIFVSISHNKESAIGYAIAER